MFYVYTITMLFWFSMIIVTYLFYLLTVAAIIITFNTTMLMSDLYYTIVEREQLKNSHIPYTDNERKIM